MEFNNSQPIYLQIINFVEIKLITKEWLSGTKLPSVRELAVQLGVNPNTIQRAFMELERKEFIFSKRGMGNFVTEDEKAIDALSPNIARQKVTQFIQEMEEIGFSIEQIIQAIEQAGGNE